MKHKFKSYLILGVVILIFLVLTKYFPGLKEFASPNYVRDFLIGYGNWGYLILVGLLLLSVPLPVPSTPIVLGGGYVYGIVVGTTLALVACAIGSSIAFLLIRKFGRPLLEILVDQKHITSFNKIFQKRGPLAAFISFAIPLFPSDAVSMILGLTRIKYRVFFTILMVAHVPRYLILNSLGEDLYTGFSLKTLLALILGALFILIAIFRKQIKRFMFKELKELEDEAEYVGEKLGLIERSKIKVQEIKKKVKKRIKKQKRRK